MSDFFVEIGGVEWCVVHSGLLDECASERTDDDGNRVCDLWDDTSDCDIVALFRRVTP